MATVPSMMILYDSDAVEVRYSDGSRLQLSPCGASMLHVDPPSDHPPHPLAAMKDGAQKWTQFVTSSHKAKVMQALDFRNRFAHRPFLSSTLMSPEDVVSLYAKVDRVAWPQSPKDTDIQVLEDGSRRAVSGDQHASIVLSPHGQDFTVCYLSAIGDDAKCGTAPNHHHHGQRFSSQCDDAKCGSSPDHQRGECLSRCDDAKCGSSPNQRDDRVSHSQHEKEGLSVPGGLRSQNPRAEAFVGGSEARRLRNSQETTGDRAREEDNRRSVGLHRPDAAGVNLKDDSTDPVAANRSVHQQNTSGAKANDRRIVTGSESSVDPHNAAKTNDNSNGRSSELPGGEGRDTAGEATLEASGLILSDGTVSAPGYVGTPSADLQSSVLSLVHHDISSISRVSSPDCLRGALCFDETLPQDLADHQSPRFADVFHSSPLSLVNTQQRRPDTVEEGVQAGDRRTPAQVLHSSPLSLVNTQQRRPDTVEEGVQAGDGTLTDSDALFGCEKVGGVASKEAVVVVRSSTPHGCEMVEGCVDDRGNLPPSGSSGPPPVNNPAETMVTQGGDDGTLPQTLFRSQTKQQVPDDKSRLTTREPCDSLRQSGGERREAGRGCDNKQCSQKMGEERRGCCDKSQCRQCQESKEGGRGSGYVPVTDNWTDSRQRYTWVTQHISCSDCPPAWRHPLKVLQQVDPTDCLLVSECGLTLSSNKAMGLSASCAAAGDSATAVFSWLAAPLPLACPFQHLHAWQPRHSNPQDQALYEELGQLHQGRFKVIMMEGTIYRFIHLANMAIVEIYPGDGSVLISQGLSGCYFSHIVWRDGKLEEKTYSVRALPPPTTKSAYVEKLVKRGHRLLTGFKDSARFSQAEELPCWKRAPMQIVEPLSTSVLEECSVPGYGRFTAFSNGRIRIVFEDRTALDMMADFSQRRERCLKHSHSSQFEQDAADSADRLRTVRGQAVSSQCSLMLPSGRSVTVDAHRPGPHHRYIEVAKEWTKWVQSSPTERRHFYQQKADHQRAHISAEGELKKIECFNYIVDHMSLVGTDSAPVPVSHDAAVPPSTARSYQHHTYQSHGVAPRGDYHQQVTTVPTRVTQPYGGHGSTTRGNYHQPGTTVPQQPYGGHGLTPRGDYHQPSTASVSHSYGGHGVTLRGEHQPAGTHSRNEHMLQGFDKVREALLRTSQMIKDIDEIVEDRKTKTN